MKRNRLQQAADDAVEALLKKELTKADGNVRATARALACNRITVLRYIERFGLRNFTQTLRDNAP